MRWQDWSEQEGARKYIGSHEFHEIVEAFALNEAEIDRVLDLLRDWHPGYGVDYLNGSTREHDADERITSAAVALGIIATSNYRQAG